MRLAVLSDIHGNLIALEAALADLQARGGSDLTWCLGDLAASAPRPAECVARIRALAAENEGKTFRVIGGNTDRYLVSGARSTRPRAADGDAWARTTTDFQTRDAVFNWGAARLTFDDYTFLYESVGRELEKSVPGYGYVVGFHGSPGDDEGLLQPDTPDEQVLDALLDQGGRLALGGHIHRQMDRTIGGWRLVNPGSIGLPFDGYGSACYALLTFTGDQLAVDLRRVPVDTEAMLADYRTVGYPDLPWAEQMLRGH